MLHVAENMVLRMWCYGKKRMPNHTGGRFVLINAFCDTYLDFILNNNWNIFTNQSSFFLLRLNDLKIISNAEKVKYQLKVIFKISLIYFYASTLDVTTTRKRELYRPQHVRKKTYLIHSGVLVTHNFCIYWINPRTIPDDFWSFSLYQNIFDIIYYCYRAFNNIPMFAKWQKY